MFEKHSHSGKHNMQLFTVIGAVVFLVGYVIVSMTVNAIKEQQAKKIAKEELRKQQDAIIFERKLRIAATTILVKETLRIMLQDKAIPDSEPADAWGNQIKITVDGDIESRKCVVTSAGPDQKFDTGDDISEWKTTAMAVGKDIGKTTANFGVGILKGVVDSAKDNLGYGK